MPNKPYELTDNVKPADVRFYITKKGRSRVYNTMIEKLLKLSKDYPEKHERHKAVNRLCETLDSGDSITPNFKTYLCAVFGLDNKELFSLIK